MGRGPCEAQVTRTGEGRVLKMREMEVPRP